MKKKYVLMAAFIAAFFSLLGSCSPLENVPEDPEDNGENPYTRISLTTKQTGFVQAGNAFAGRFIDRIDENAGKNNQDEWIVSPLSLQIALGMLLNGAQGETASEICRTLGYKEGETAEVNAWCKLMLEQLPILDKKTELSLANAIFYNKKITLKGPYRDVVESNYKASLEALDFSQTKAAADVINAWCDKQTKGLIPHVIDEVSPSMLAYLVNALYFKGKWANPFAKSATDDETFTDESGKKGKVKMMKLDGKEFNYDENDLWQAIRLPYGNGAYSMTVLLPKKGHTVREITAALAKDPNVVPYGKAKADLWLPAFETKYDIGLNKILNDMGMQRAFDPRFADFLAMSDYDSFVSFVQQDAVIKVNEEGSEAAAVTIIGVDATAYIPQQPQKVVFHADHPFLYLITESSTGTILFAGKYAGK